MGSLVELITPYHTRTQRDYLARMVDDKVHCMEKAREYGFDYWDGDRRYGYGGYKYIEGYWTPLAEQLIARYGLTNESRILDVGCGKAFLLHEIQPWLSLGSAADKSLYEPIADGFFDLVLAMGSLHNLKNWERATAYKEIQRVGKQAYLWVESYRNAQEQFNLQCWALTCWAFLTPEEWVWEMQQAGYTGDYEFVYFQ
jgi:SAM-dependent methyltransferase